MSLAHIHSRALAGVNAPPVTVEVHLSSGLPCLSIVGLPEAAVKESKDRVRSAIINSGFDFPQRRLTINLAPAVFKSYKLFCSYGPNADIQMQIFIRVIKCPLSPESGPFQKHKIMSVFSSKWTSFILSFRMK